MEWCAPFWTITITGAIHGKLLGKNGSLATPSNAKVAFRALRLPNRYLAVTMTFGFVAAINWRVCSVDGPDAIIDRIGFNMCAQDRFVVFPGVISGTYLWRAL